MDQEAPRKKLKIVSKLAANQQLNIKLSKDKRQSIKGNEMLLDDIIDIIQNQTPHNYEARCDQDGKPYPSIANMGIKKDQQAILSREGEYHGITIRAMESESPSLTNLRIIRILRHLEKKEFIPALNQISDQLHKYGPDISYFIVEKWLKKLTLPVPDIISDQQESIEQFNKKYENDQQFKHQINTYVDREYQSPLAIRFKIESPGFNENINASVIPEEWVDREYSNANELHREMDKLPWRIGRPQVVYCVTYSLNIITESSWQDHIKIYKTVDSVIWITRSESIQVKIFNEDQQNQINKIKEFDNNTQFLQIRGRDTQNQSIIAINKSHFFNLVPTYTSKERVGVLASRIQKCIRRGRHASGLLAETVYEISQCKPYNLPDMKMVRVSASRQILWRLLITCFEDSRPYLNTSGLINILPISILALICQNDPNCQLNKELIDMIVLTSLALQRADQKDDIWEWRLEKQQNVMGSTTIKQEQLPTEIIQALDLSITYQPMMEGDKYMLSNYKLISKELAAKLKYPCRIKLDKLECLTLEEYLKDSKVDVCQEAKLASIDMHCQPMIIIELQASLPFLPNDEYTTQKLSSFIWETSSKFNVRYNSKPELKTKLDQKVFQQLREIQEQFFKEPIQQKQVQQIEQQLIPNDQVIPTYIGRLAFIILFGAQRTLEYKKQKYDISLCGTIEQPFKIKFTGEIEGVQPTDEIKLQVQQHAFEYYQSKQIQIQVPEAPFGYFWRFNHKYLTMMIDQDHNVEITELKQTIPMLNGSILISKRSIAQLTRPNEEQQLFMKELLFIRPQRKHILNQNIISHTQLEWKYLLKESYMPIVAVFSLVLSRLLQHELIQFSITRAGLRSELELSYQYEGMVLRMMVLFQLVYPGALMKVGSKYTWKINKAHQCYFTMIQDLQEICRTASSNKQIIRGQFSIQTQLWDHQQSSADRISDGVINQQKKGFGDASCVGGGKTLTALAVMQKIWAHEQQSQDSYRGFLVLVPQKILLPTWIQEVYKHTKGCHIVVQLSNGTLTELKYGQQFVDKVVKNPPTIQFQSNTIVITTLGRFRDHGIPQNPLFYLQIVDECLSIQNNDTFQTQAACKQAFICKYGTILLSATFFRSRFDKLFYLLQILQTQLPNNRQYLDCILNESIVCFIKANQKQWVTNNNTFKLNEQQMQYYEEIRNLQISPEQKYMKLFQYLHNSFDICEALSVLINQIEQQYKDCRILIYGHSQNETQLIAQKISNVGLYPDLTNRHVVIPYTTGVYGLNDLVCCNMILTRPPEPDKLPQMKGRLDRPGQKSEQLIMQYFWIENTIEEALMARIQLASKFINQYLMPLAQFYNLAVEQGPK